MTYFLVIDHQEDGLAVHRLPTEQAAHTLADELKDSGYAGWAIIKGEIVTAHGMVFGVTD